MVVLLHILVLILEHLNKNFSHSFHLLKKHKALKYNGTTHDEVPIHTFPRIQCFLFPYRTIACLWCGCTVLDLLVCSFLKLPCSTWAMWCMCVMDVWENPCKNMVTTLITHQKSEIRYFHTSIQRNVNRDINIKRQKDIYISN